MFVPSAALFIPPGNILLRLTLPPALFLLAAPYFLPKTSSNVRAYLARAEAAHFPELSAQHDALYASLRRNLSGIEGSARAIGASAKENAGRVVQQVEGTTGLRLGEVMGRAREMEEKVAREVERERAMQEARAVKDGEVVGVVLEETPVAEIVAVPAASSSEAKASGTKADASVKPAKRLV